MLLSDKQIKELAIERKMIDPFIDHLVREVDGRKVISHSLSSYGYDLRLADHDFRIFRHVPGSVVDPKRFSSENLEMAKLHEDEDGRYFIIPANSYALGVSVECLNMPDNVTAIATGKSTYARCGIIANLTPVEAGFRGYLTLEFSNASSADCRVYTEGVVQLLFLQGAPCEVTYEARKGKYQDQAHEVTLARV